MFQKKNDNIPITDDEWKKSLSEKEYHVLREKGTEMPFSGRYHKAKDKGIYVCAGCGSKLFLSDTKFDSGTGWPSFYSPISDDSVATQSDGSLLTERTEVHCSQCGGHLGHVFNDGPQPTGKRYCVNSVSLKLTKEEKKEEKS